MENHSLVGDAVQMMGDAADFVVQKAAPAVLGAVLGVSAAHADTMKAVPVASQVAPIKVEVTKATLQGLKIDPDSLADFDKLAAANQGKVLFFLDGLKKAQKFPDTAAEKLPSLKEAAEKLIFLFGNHEMNTASRDAMKKQANALENVCSVERLITRLSDPQTYGMVLASADSPYGQRFSQIKQEMRDTYAEAKKLQDVAKNMESPELTAARAELTKHQAELARNKATNAAMRQIIAHWK